MKKICFILSSVLTAPWVHAVTQQEIDAAARDADKFTGQQQQRLDVEKELLEGPKKPSGVDLKKRPALPVDPKELDSACVALKRINVKGSNLIDEWELEVFEAPFLGKCITPELASNVLASATDFYLTRGFITSRAYLPNQNLKQGVLEVLIAEGKVSDVIVHSGSQLNVDSAFAKDEDLGLNIRDLEQAVDQMNAVPGNNVVMAVKPGDEPQSSQVVFENKGKPGLRGWLSLDNAGTEATGKNGASLSLQAGDLLNLNDVWSLSVRHSIGSAAKSNKSVNLDVKIPDSYNSYSFGYTKGGFDTVLNFPMTGAELTNEGANESVSVSFDRVVHRDQSSKHSVGLKLKRDSVESFIADTRIDVNSRSLNSLVFSTESVLAFDRNVLIVNPDISAGLIEVDNLPKGVNTPVENPQAEYLRYKISVDWIQPITFNNNQLRWKSKWVGQYASMPLYASQQLILGGASSVRGSYGVSIVGDSGYFWQNTLSLYKKLQLSAQTLNVEYSIGYDFGRVWSARSQAYEGGIKAAVVGASINTGGPWSLSLMHSLPLSVDGGIDKADPHTSATLSVEF